MNVWKMPVKEWIKNEIARTHVLGCVLVVLALLLDAITLVDNLAAGRPLLAAFHVGIAPLLLGGWMLERAQLLGRIAELKKAAPRTASC